MDENIYSKYKEIFYYTHIFNKIYEYYIYNWIKDNSMYLQKLHSVSFKNVLLEVNTYFYGKEHHFYYFSTVLKELCCLFTKYEGYTICYSTKNPCLLIVNSFSLGQNNALKNDSISYKKVLKKLVKHIQKPRNHKYRVLKPPNSM